MLTAKEDPLKKMQNVAIQRQETHRQMLHEFTCINQKDLMDKEKHYLEQTLFQLRIIQILFDYKDKFVVVDDEFDDSDLTLENMDVVVCTDIDQKGDTLTSTNPKPDVSLHDNING